MKMMMIPMILMILMMRKWQSNYENYNEASSISLKDDDFSADYMLIMMIMPTIKISLMMNDDANDNYYDNWICIYVVNNYVMFRLEAR